MKSIRSIKLVAIIAILAVVGLIVYPYIPTVKAATNLTEAMVRLDRLTTSTATSGRVCATPSATNLASTEASVQVTFPSGFTVNGTAGNWTVNTTGLDSGQTAWPGINTATAVSSQTVTFPSTNLSSASTLYCFNFTGTSTLSTPGSTGNNLNGTITTRTSGPVDIDSSSYALSIISNDQITVTASVGATFTFSLSGNSDSFSGNLDPSLVNSTTGKTVTLTTNASLGWILWATDSQNNGSGRGSLHSSSASKYIAGASAVGTASRTMTTGTEDYGLAATINTDFAGGGTVSLNTNYDGTSSKVGTLDPTGFQPIASANGTSGGDIVNVLERATISNSTPPATDYTDTITLVGAGQF